MSVKIIAEIGKNFIDREGMEDVGEALTKAKSLARSAKFAGADVAKFQTHVFEDEQKKRSEKRYEWIKLNENLTPYNSFWVPLKKYCDEIGVEFMTTPMSKMAAEKVNNLVERWKVGSADIVDFELLEYLKSTGKPITISTGMSMEDEVEKAVDFLGDSLQMINYCISIYPCPVYRIKFMDMVLLNKYGKPVGWSDHTLSMEVPALAVRMGVKAVEKHFTLDRNAFGPDHKVSLLPSEFNQMAHYVKEAEKVGDNFDEEVIHWSNFRV